MSHTFTSEDIRSVRQLGNEIAQLLKDVQKNRRPVFLMNRGKAAGVFMDVDEYERLLELLEFHQTILAAEAEADRGEVISHEQLEKESKEWVKQATRRKSTKSNGQKRRNGLISKQSWK